MTCNITSHLSWIFTRLILAWVAAWSLGEVEMSTWPSLTSISPARQSRLSKQWAAVRIFLLDMRTPPQILLPHLFTRETIQGKLPSSALLPPKMFKSKDAKPHFSVCVETPDCGGEDVVENVSFLSVPVTGLV